MSSAFSWVFEFFLSYALMWNSSLSLVRYAQFQHARTSKPVDKECAGVVLWQWFLTNKRTGKTKLRSLWLQQYILDANVWGSSNDYFIREDSHEGTQYVSLVIHVQHEPNDNTTLLALKLTLQALTLTYPYSWRSPIMLCFSAHIQKARS